MKKIISLMLAIVCIMSLGLSGCGEEEMFIESSATIQDVLDMLNNEGYTNIEHEEDTNSYTVSGVYDFVFSMNYNTSKPEDYVESVSFELNQTENENNNLINIILNKIIGNKEIIDDVMIKFDEANSENKSYINQKFGNLSFHYLDRGKDYSSISKYRYHIELIILSE